MTVESILIRGGVARSNLEATADAILAFPRCLWLGRSVEVKQNDNNELEAVMKLDKFKSTEGGYGRAPGFVELFFVVGAVTGFIAVSIVALPFFAVGSLLKKISIETEPKSAIYHAIVQDKLDLNSAEGKIAKLEKDFVNNDEAILKTAVENKVTWLTKEVIDNIHNEKDVNKISNKIGTNDKLYGLIKKHVQLENDIKKQEAFCEEKKAELAKDINSLKNFGQEMPT